MIALYIFSLAVFVAYVGAILWRFGVPTSISESYYLWTQSLRRHQLSVDVSSYRKLSCAKPTSTLSRYRRSDRSARRHLFGGFCIVTALPLMIFWLECTDGTAFQFLVFLSCAPLMFVGAAGAFREIDLTGKVHFTAAGLSSLASQTWIALNTHWWIASLVLLAVAGILARKIEGRDAEGTTRSAWLFHIEVAAFLCVYVAVLAYYISN